MTGGFRRYTCGSADFAIVELIGRPASGKSQLAASLARMPGWAAMSPVPAERPRVRVLSPLAALSAPIFSFCLLTALATRKGVGVRQVRGALTVIRRYVALKRIRGRGIHVIDEGPTHALFSVLFGTTAPGGSSDGLKRLLAMIADRVTYFALLDVSAETCLHRARARDVPSSDFTADMSEDTARAFLADETYEEILDELEAVDRTKILRFGSGDAAEAFLIRRALDPQP